MKLNSVSANRHILAREGNGRPLRLLLNFDENRVLRLRVAGDGSRMIVDHGQLEGPSDIGECGRTDIADVTQSLFPRLRSVEVTEVRALNWQGGLVGVKLTVDGGDPFHFWVDDDELYWGDGAALVDHDWLDGLGPTASERIEV